MKKTICKITALALSLSLLCANLTACGTKPFEYASTLTAVPNEAAVSLDITGNVNLPNGTVVELKATALRDGYQEIYDKYCVSEKGVVREGIVNSLNEVYPEWTSETIEATVTEGTYTVSIPLAQDMVNQSYEIAMECDLSGQGEKQTKEVMKVVGKEGKKVLNYKPTSTTVAYPNEAAITESNTTQDDEIGLFYSMNSMRLQMAAMLFTIDESFGRDFTFSEETEHFQFTATNKLIEGLKTDPDYKGYLDEAWDSQYSVKSDEYPTIDEYYAMTYNSPVILDVFDESGTLIAQRINGDFNWNI